MVKNDLWNLSISRGLSIINGLNTTIDEKTKTEEEIKE